MTDESGASSLFDTNPTGGHRLLLHPTNRYNLLEILSSGLIAPRGAYDKYYADYLDVTPGRIPIFTRALPSEALDVATRESDTSFPVALELDPDRLSAAPVPAYAAGDHTLSLAASDAEAWAPATILPLAAVIAVHFRSDRELDEHRARAYPNIGNAVALRATPEIFAAAKPRPEIDTWLRRLPAIDVPTAAQFTGADRRAGALTLIAQAMWPTRAVFDDVVGLLAPAKKRKTGRAAETAAPGLPAWLTSAFGTSRTKRLTLDAALYAAAWDVIAAQDLSRRWRPLEVVAAIRDRAEALASAKDRPTLERALAGIAEILRNEREFKPFTAEKGLTAARALLLVLLRPEPDRLLAWPADQTGADGATVSAAAALSGLLSGRKRLDVELRPRELDELHAARQITQLDPPDALAVLPDTAVTVVEDESAAGIEFVLSVNQRPQITRTLRRSALARQLLGGKLDPGTADHDLALRICRELGWHDAVTTALHVGSAGFTVSPRGAKELEIRIAGFSPASLILDTIRFRDRLEHEGIPDGMSFDAVDAVAPAPPSEPDSAE